MSRGWYRESYRHRLASYGITTSKHHKFMRFAEKTQKDIDREVAEYKGLLEDQEKITETSDHKESKKEEITEEEKLELENAKLSREMKEQLTPEYMASIGMPNEEIEEPDIEIHDSVSIGGTPQVVEDEEGKEAKEKGEERRKKARESAESRQADKDIATITQYKEIVDRLGEFKDYNISEDQKVMAIKAIEVYKNAIETGNLDDPQINALGGIGFPGNIYGSKNKQLIIDSLKKANQSLKNYTSEEQPAPVKSGDMLGISSEEVVKEPVPTSTTSFKVVKEAKEPIKPVEKVSVNSQNRAMLGELAKAEETRKLTVPETPKAKVKKTQDIKEKEKKESPIIDVSFRDVKPEKTSNEPVIHKVKPYDYKESDFIGWKEFLDKADKKVQPRYIPKERGGIERKYKTSRLSFNYEDTDPYYYKIGEKIKEALSVGINKVPRQVGPFYAAPGSPLLISRKPMELVPRTWKHGPYSMRSKKDGISYIYGKEKRKKDNPEPHTPYEWERKHIPVQVGPYYVPFRRILRPIRPRITTGWDRPTWNLAASKRRMPLGTRYKDYDIKPLGGVTK